MDGLKFTFERGGTIYARLFDLTSESKKSILEILPIESNINHTRWCGREVYTGIKTTTKPSKENQTAIASKFDVTYWRDWDRDCEGKGQQAESLSLFYGTDLLQWHDGLLHVNVIGRVGVEQEDLLEEIGLRVWQQGSEKVTVEYFSF